jgi:hypothetical protein
MGSAVAVVDITLEGDGEPDCWSGIYANSLPSQPFLDNNTVVVNTQLRSYTSFFTVDLRNNVEGYFPPTASWTFLASCAGAFYFTSIQL